MSDSSRKRANVACSFCRRRKRRCNGSAPCALCEASNVECVYDDTDPQRTKGSTSSPDLQERLKGLEALLEQQSRRLEAFANGRNDQVPTTSLDPPPQPLFREQNLPHAFSPVTFGEWPVFGQNNPHPDTHSPELSSGRDLPPMVIPRGHSTTTDNLLSSEPVKNVLGNFPSNLFVSKEAERGWPGGPLMAWDPVDNQPLPVIVPSDARALVDSFFDLAHPEFPILHQQLFHNLFERTLEAGLQHDTESALVLVILAVGSIVAEPRNNDEDLPEESHPSFRYIVPALRILSHEALNTFGTTAVLSQGLFLAAKFYGYLLRPLQSWRLVHMASTNIQHLCNQNIDIGWPETDDTALIAWAIFATECDLIAEHQLPRSGIEHVVDSMPLPRCHDHGSETSLSFMAELAVRRLLNRVHHTIYDNNLTNLSLRVTTPSVQGEAFKQQPVPAVMKVSIELDRQLEVWFSLLPSSIRPDLEDETASNSRQLNLIHRYHSARDIIFRPFVVYAWTLSADQQLPEQVLACCQTCLQSCRSYVLTATHGLNMIRSNKEILIHSILATTIVLTLSALSPLLEALIPDISDLHKRAISAVEKCSFPDSSVEEILAALRLIQAKFQLVKPRIRRL